MITIENAFYLFPCIALPRYQKTNAVLKTAGEKTTSAFSTMGAFTSRKLGDMR